MKTYLNYLAHKIKESWKEDNLNILIPSSFISGVGLMFGGLFMSFVSYWLAVGMTISGVLLSLLPIPILWLGEKISEEIKEFREWKSSSISPKRKTTEKVE